MRKRPAVSVVVSRSVSMARTRAPATGAPSEAVTRPLSRAVPMRVLLREGVAGVVPAVAVAEAATGSAGRSATSRLRCSKGTLGANDNSISLLLPRPAAPVPARALTSTGAPVGTPQATYRPSPPNFATVCTIVRPTPPASNRICAQRTTTLPSEMSSPSVAANTRPITAPALSTDTPQSDVTKVRPPGIARSARMTRTLLTTSIVRVMASSPSVSSRGCSKPRMYWPGGIESTR